MHSFSADPANSHYTTRIHPALTGFADEVRGTLARLCAYVMTLALLAILGIALWDALPDAMVTEPSTKDGWSQVGAPGAGICRQPSQFTRQNRGLRDIPASRGGPQGYLPLDRRRQEAGRRTRNLPPGRRAPRAEPRRGRHRRQDGSGRCAGARSRRGHRQQVRYGHTARPDRRHRARSRMPRIYQADRRSAFADLRLVMPGRRSAGPPRAVGCMLNRLVLLAAGNDAKLAELFARAELRRSDCAATAAPALSADWITGADNPRLRGAL